ncbi:MAG: XdhC/CoxI family protein [Coleofasciculaceae cyanobacterium]
MKEIEAIIAAFEQKKNEKIALATVIEVSGSTYRRPGAKMLMSETGTRIGSISGGCLEEDVFEQAKVVMASGKSTIIQYDTTSPDDIIWGLGLGCNGLVRVFIELLTPQLNPISFIAECWRQRQIGVIATVVTDTEIGKYLMLQQDGKVTSDLNLLASSVLNDAHVALNKGKSLLKLYQLPQGQAQIFLEVIQPPIPLVIFGALHDAQPVVELAKALAWQVTVVDSRPAYAKRESFLAADDIIIAHPEQVSEKVCLNSGTVAVVMTHNYLHDQEILRTLLPSTVSYIGILGPKSRTQQLLSELEEEGINPTYEQLQRLYGPVGLDIGADTPEEIALAIIAEIKAVLADRGAGFLRNRTQPIHQPVAQQNTVSRSQEIPRDSTSIFV